MTENCLVWFCGGNLPFYIGIDLSELLIEISPYDLKRGRIVRRFLKN